MRPLFEASFLTPHDSQLATAVARAVRPLPLKGGARTACFWSLPTEKILLIVF